MNLDVPELVALRASEHGRYDEVARLAGGTVGCLTEPFRVELDPDVRSA